MTRFSERQGYVQEPEITVREEAPKDVRGMVASYAYDSGLKPERLRMIVCRVLMIPPDVGKNWSTPNIEGEVRHHLETCEWFNVYDIIEEIQKELNRDMFSGEDDDLFAETFEDKINRLLKAKGVGWKLASGKIETRGPESFEKAVRDAGQELQRTGRTTAASELHEALRDLSRRPEPDITGAVSHGMNVLECTFRDVVGEKGTLGKLLADHRDLFPKPLDEALEKLWGFASQYGRHVEEGKKAEHRDALLVVQIAAACSQYLIASTEKK